jgi:hypothetical protein
MAAHEDRDTSPLFEIAIVLVRFDHVTRFGCPDAYIKNRTTESNHGAAH